MPNLRGFVLVASALALACAPTVTSPAAPRPLAPAAPVPGADEEQDEDPVGRALSVDGVTRACDTGLARARAQLESIAALDGAPAAALTWSATLGRFDAVMAAVAAAGEVPSLLNQVHPEAAVRAAGKACEPKVDAFTTSLWLDARIARVLRAYAAKGERLEGERARLLHDALRDLRRNGLELSPADQATLRALNDEITRAGQAFSVNISEARGTIRVKSTALEGLPKEWIAGHAKDATGLVTVSTDYPDYFPFATYSRDRSAAKALFVAFANRGGEANVKVLEKLLEFRAKKAKLLGYPSWAAYAVEPRMAESTEAVRAFLGKVRDAVTAPAQAEMKALREEHVRLGGKPDDPLPPSDRYFLEARVRARAYAFDGQELSKYLEVGAVMKGLLDVTARMYGLDYREVPARAWHPDVRAFEVYGREGGKRIGKFYLDLHPRPGKFKHAAMFSVGTARRLEGGAYRESMAALVCNFPKPGAQPALMQHEDVATFFHEFGHVLHHILTRAELATFSGTGTVRDFVEAPSQMFEEWAWSREVLDVFARHHQTGAKIPDALFASMTRARKFGRALAIQRQLVFARVDFELHSLSPPVDTTRVFEEVQTENDSFGFVAGTHPQSSFGHLVGYDGGYYSYQWALAIARDVLGRFKKEGLFDTRTAAAWRDQVLAPGGGLDEATMVEGFLGRPPSLDAYFAYLRGEE